MESKDSENPRLNKRKNVENLTDKTTNKARETQTHVKSNKLKVFYTNADSLFNKFDELKARLSCEQYDVICITEVKPKNSRYLINISEIQLEGYNIFNNVNPTGRGVIIYVNNLLKATIIDDIDLVCNDTVFVSLTINATEELILGCVYRSPNSNQDHNDKLNQVIVSVSRKNKKVLLVGDFNLPYINWNTWTTNSASNSKESVFIETVRDSFLQQCVSKSTRYRSNEKSNVLDLILVDNEEYIESLEHQSPLGKSDHEALTFDYLCSIQKIQYYKTKYYYRKADFTSMNEEFSNIDWNSLLESDNMNTVWKSFTDKVNVIVEKYVPIKKVSVNTNKKFLLSKEQREVIRKTSTME